jgi:hypothetical protein
MILKKIFGTRREEATGGGGKLYKNDLQVFFLNKCYSGYQIKENDMGRYVTLIGGNKKCIHSFCREA